MWNSVCEWMDQILTTICNDVAFRDYQKKMLWFFQQRTACVAVLPFVFFQSDFNFAGGTLNAIV